MNRESRFSFLPAAMLAGLAVSTVASGAAGTIDIAPGVTVDEAAGQMVLRVRRSDGAIGAVSVDYSTAADTAAADSDFTAASGTLDWAAGETGIRTITVALQDDAALEAVESFRVNLANAQGGVVIGNASALVRIVSNDSNFTFVRPNHAVGENAGTATLTVRRLGSRREAASVAFAMESGTAFPGEDYASSSGRLEWAANDAADKQLTVAIQDDQAVEGAEFFRARLADPAGAGAALGARVESLVSIADDDSALEFARLTTRVGEDAGIVQVSVRRVGNPVRAAQVDYAATSASARIGLDFTSTPGTLSWAAGEGGSKTFEVAALDDALEEKTEVVALRLANVSGAVAGALANARLLIEDNDGCALAPGPAVLAEWQGTATPAAAGRDIGGTPAEGAFTLPPGCVASKIDVTLSWDVFAEDLDLEVRTPAGTALKAENFQTNGEAVETLEIAAPVSGDYRAIVNGYVNGPTAYQGIAVANIVDAGSGPGLGPIPDPVSDPSRPRVVVAVLDSGINPYHERYYGGSTLYPDAHPSSVTQEVLQAFGVRPENVVQLTRTGNMVEDLSADAALWDRVQRGEAYHFKGTNIIAVSFAAPTDVVLKPDVSKSAHGVGTSSAVLRANPDAVLLMIEQGNDLGSDASHEFAFGHPAIDMLSTSYGVSVSAPTVGGTGFPYPETRAFHYAYEGVVEQGKLHFSSGGNGPGVTPLRAGAGPWWSIGVSGIEEESSEGRTLLSGNFPDFVSDYTQTLPYCMDCQAGASSVGGTSFSTPRAAGVASKVLLEARRALGHAGGIKLIGTTPVMAAGQGKVITNWFLRRGLEQGAWLPNTAAYDPVAGVFDLAGLPINPAAPYLQTAWGDLTAAPSKGVVAAALTHLGFGGTPRVKPAGYCGFQTEVIVRRMNYWNSIAPVLPDVFGGDATGRTPAQNPFVYCASPVPTHPPSNDPPPPPAG